jgi:glycosyl hydrolase family 25
MPSPIAIDVSAHEFVDWQRVANSGTRVGIAKVFQATPDGQFARNWEQIRQAGLLRGAFYFMGGPDLGIPTVADGRANNLKEHRPEFPVTAQSYVDPHTWHVNSFPTVASVSADADRVVDLITAAGGLAPGDLPIILDAEDQSVRVPTQATAAAAIGSDEAVYTGAAANKVNRWDFMPGDAGHRAAAIRQLVSAWLDRIQQRLPRMAGRRPMIYTGFFFWRDTLGNPLQTDGGDPFSQFPLWLASYNPLANVQVPDAWRQNDFMLWQYSDSETVDGVFSSGNHAVLTNCDANKIVSITRPDAAHPNRLTLVESADITPLETLAAIAQRGPAHPVSLARQYPVALDVAPTNAFNLLLVTQGFWADEIPDVVRQFWEGAHAHGAVDGLLDIPPFNGFRVPDQPGLVVHFDPAPGAFLGLRQVPSARAVEDLVLPPDAVDRLAHMLGNLQVHVDSAGTGTDLPASTIWPIFPDVSGMRGTLIAVLRKAPLPPPPPPNAPPKPAELYQVDATETAPWPVVAVNVAADQWPRVVARAIGQIQGGLGDEYELDGAPFAAPSADLAPPYAPNLRYLRAEQRSQLGPPANKNILDVVPTLKNQWSLPAGDLPFLAHPGTDPNPDWHQDPAFAAPATQPGRFKAVEGGGGYRSGVLRSDFDCLMRRMPSDRAGTMVVPANLPIQQRVDFCTTCLQILRRVTSLSLRPRVRLGSQRLLFDTIRWPAITVAPTLPFSQTLSPTAASGARWACQLQVGPDGFSLTDIKLDHRGDPFSSVSTLFASIGFEQLSLQLAGAAVTPLPLRDALVNRANPPKLEVAIDGGEDHQYQIGVKLSLSWSIPSPPAPPRTPRDRCRVDAILSVVFKGEAPDIDPHGAVLGCRVYPQLAVRFRQLRSGDSVRALSGAVRIGASNAIPQTQTGLPAELRSLASGKLSASAFCESNVAGSDTTFSALAGAPLRSATGRKLAALRGQSSPKLPIGFPPPHWSWRYDYAHPLLPDVPPPLAVVHRADEPAHVTPPVAATWPPTTAFHVTAAKQPRQGDYDAIAIQPVRGDDASNRPIVAAPMCGDLGVQLQLRHGLSSIHAQRVQGPFLGWGAGRADQGYRSVRGAPLVPPNQHVDISLRRVNDGRIDLVYTAECRDPRSGEWQVILEQGLSCGIRYVLDAGLTFDDLAFVARATGAVDEATLEALRQAQSDTAHPSVFDTRIRAVYQALFPSYRFYDPTIEIGAPGSIQQVPDVTGPPAVMEKS